MVHEKMFNLTHTNQEIKFICPGGWQKLKKTKKSEAFGSTPAPETKKSLIINGSLEGNLVASIKM